MSGGNARKGREVAGGEACLRRGAVTQHKASCRATDACRADMTARFLVSPEGRPARRGPCGPARCAAEGRGGVLSPVVRDLSCCGHTGTGAALTNATTAPRRGGAGHL